MPPQSPTFGPLDEVLGALLETWGQRYRFEMNRAERLLLLSKPPDNEVGAKELPDGRIHVVYLISADQTGEEFCSVSRAVQLIEALMVRDNLEPVTPVPSRPRSVPAQERGWLSRFFRRT
jgi:hypothetical protein